MNRLILTIALLTSGVAFAQASFTVTPIDASLFVQDDGQCRGHITYAITSSDGAIAADVGAETAQIEVRVACARLTALAQDEVFDDHNGKLTINVRGARTFVWSSDPDGRAGPRVAGECDLQLFARVAPTDATASRVFRPRMVERARAAPTCAPLTNLITNSCWVARGNWPADVAFPSIPKCTG